MEEGFFQFGRTGAEGQVDLIRFFAYKTEVKSHQIFDLFEMGGGFLGQ